MVRPIGAITRGTTAANRLRRVDRWLLATHSAVLASAADPLVVDLGYGENPVTTVELATRLAALRPGTELLGLEIDPGRVAAAQPLSRPGLRFALGGFELGPAALLAGRRPVAIRAFNVLRQYAEADVASAWSLLCPRLAPGGVLLDGTCDEPGRLACWVTLGQSGPVSLTLAARLASLGRPGRWAERLPKALIHRNVPGERIHALLRAADDAWDAAAPYAAFGPRARWTETVRLLTAAEWPVRWPARARFGELTVAWNCVAPVS